MNHNSLATPPRHPKVRDEPPPLERRLAANNDTDDMFGPVSPKKLFSEDHHGWASHVGAPHEVMAAVIKAMAETMARHFSGTSSSRHDAGATRQHEQSELSIPLAKRQRRE